MKNFWSGLGPLSKMFVVGVALTGVYFGVQAFSKSGKAGGLTQGILGKAAVANNKVVDKIEGKEALDVCINQWSGWAGGAYMNGGGKASAESRFYREHGIPVNLIFIPDLTSLDAWKADQCQVHWVTFDSWSTYIGGLVSEKPEGFIQVDWSDGGDAFLGAPGVKSVSDLRGQSVAVATKSPSQTLLIRALEANNMTQSDIKIVEAKDGLDAASMFEAGKVKGALVWAPDDKRLLSAVAGSRVLMSTKQCNRCIADGFFAKADFIAENKERLTAFAAGWLAGNAAVKSDPQARAEAVSVLASLFEVSDADVAATIDAAQLMTVGDNQQFFGIKQGGAGAVTGRQLYTDMSYKFKDVGAVEGEAPEWSKVSTADIVRSLQVTEVAQQASAPKKFERLSTVEAAKAEAVTQKDVSIEFATNTDALSDDAKLELDGELKSLVTSFAGARFRIEGNTDNVGNDAYNQDLSLRRARAVALYLSTRYNADPDKFVVVGNGESKAVADNSTPTGRAKNRRTDVQILATP